MDNPKRKKRLSDPSYSFGLVVRSFEKKKQAYDKIDRTTKSLKSMETKHPGRCEIYAQQKENKLNEIINLEKELTSKLDEFILQVEKELKTHSVKEIIKKHAEFLEYFETECLELLKLKQAKNPSVTFTLMTELFYKLSNLNSEFLVYTPEICLKTGSTKNSAVSMLKFLSLNKNQLDILDNSTVKDSSLAQNYTFITTYAKYFASQMPNLTSIEDVKFCLLIHPETYLTIPKELKTKLFAPNGFRTISSKSPQVFLYMSNEEIEQIAKSDERSIGRAIVNCPAVLDKLDNKFFSRHNVKRCFGNFSKQQIIDALKEKISQNEDIQSYISDVKHNFNSSANI